MSETPIERMAMEVVGLANKIGATKDMLPDFGLSTVDSKPFVLVDGDLRLTYHYVVKERGIELEHVTTLNRDLILYLIFRRVVWNIAWQQSHTHRDDIDPRRLLFARIEELLGQLSTDWQQRQRARHQDTLLANPFDDYVTRRTDFIVELRRDGLSAEEATRQGYKKYPKPILSQ